VRARERWERERGVLALHVRTSRCDRGPRNNDIQANHQDPRSTLLRASVKAIRSAKHDCCIASAAASSISVPRTNLTFYTLSVVCKLIFRVFHRSAFRLQSALFRNKNNTTRWRKSVSCGVSTLCLVTVRTVRVSGHYAHPRSRRSQTSILQDDASD
jgi:hypothetical protein